jgi:hypothetical protein
MSFPSHDITFAPDISPVHDAVVHMYFSSYPVVWSNVSIRKDRCASDNRSHVLLPVTNIVYSHNFMNIIQPIIRAAIKRMYFIYYRISVKRQSLLYAARLMIILQHTHLPSNLCTATKSTARCARQSLQNISAIVTIRRALLAQYLW